MKPAPLLLALALAGCNRITSPVEPLTPAPPTLSLWPVCEAPNSQPIWFVTNAGAGASPAGTWTIGTAVSGLLPPLTPGATVTLDHPGVTPLGGKQTLAVQDGGATFTSSITCTPYR